ncbi:MAG: hypothetical protein WCI04_03700 [archaeon]
MQILDEYKGEVLFIVHAPDIGPRPETEVIWKRILGPERTLMQKTLVRQNRTRIKQSLEIAGKKGVPVIYISALGHDGKDTLNKILSLIKKKPRTIEIHEKIIGRLKPKQIIDALTTGNIIPTNITFLGQLREDCVKTAILATRKALPNTPITIMGGKGTIFMGGDCSRIKLKKIFSQNKISRTKKLKASTWHKK